MADGTGADRGFADLRAAPEPGLARPARSMRTIVLALLCGAGLSFLLVRGVALSGDERFYDDTSSHIALCLLGRQGGGSIAAVVNPIVANGWFLPGMSLLLAPVQLVCDAAAPVVLLRAWMIPVNTLLLALIARELLRSGLPFAHALGGVLAGFLVPYVTCPASTRPDLE